MRHILYKVYTIFFILFATLAGSSCYQTRNIPEDEYLYAGIKEIAYGHSWGEKQKKSKDSTGVITAMGDAYYAVENILNGNAPTIQNTYQQIISKEELDSINHQKLIDKEAYNTARSEAYGALAYAPNGSIMGSSKWTHPFTIDLWVWNRYAESESAFGKWMMNTFGATPKYISTANPKIRTQIARNTLRNFGFFRSEAIYRIEDVKNPRKKKISYQVLPRELFHLDRIEYKDFPTSIDTIIREHLTESHLKTAMPFNVSALSNERDRLTSILRNQGYYYFRNDHIAFRADTLERPLQVQLQIVPSPTLNQASTTPFYIGNTKITILKYNTHELTDSLKVRNFNMFWSGGGKRKPSLRLSAFSRYLHQKKGDLYRQDMQSLMQKELSNMGIFSSVQVNYIPRDTSLLAGKYNNKNLCDTLDLEILCTLDKPYDSEFEAKITNKTNGLLGPGLAYSINKRNAFRGAETLTWGANASYEWQTGANMKGDNTGINSWELGTNLSLTYPRFVFFGNLWRKLDRKTRATTLFKLDAKWMNRAGYYGSASAGARLKWTFQKGENIIHEFTPIHLEYNHLLSTSQRFDSLMSENPALYESLRDKLVPSMEYSFTWTSAQKQKHQGRVSLFTKQAIQFQKYTAEYSHMLRLTQKSQLVFRGFLGGIWNYGDKTAPYADLFSAGGANSIRAFGVRGIGPGSYNPAKSSYSYLDQVGNIRFECNAEYRFPIIGNLFGAIFIDAGNVWLTHDDPSRPGGQFQWKNLGKELALGTGAGVRYDLDFLVIRFDLGVGIHAPYDTGKEGYYNIPSFGKSLGYHFAVGYPF
jgi:outer membrane protein assembly factor BamA